MNMGLFLVGFGSEDEVLGDDWKLVQYEKVAGAGIRYVG
jgi:hypothetical protein